MVLLWVDWGIFLRFTGRIRRPTTSGGPIFRCTTKDRGERRASSSQAPHPSFCLSGQKLSRSAAPPLPTKPTSLGFGGAPFLHCFRRTQLYCSNCGEFVGTLRITCLIYSRKLGGCVSSTHSTAPAARRGKGISDSAAADLIASNAPLRNGSHKARQNGPKHYPGDPTGAAAPLVCLSPLSFFKQRKMGPPEVASKVER